MSGPDDPEALADPVADALAHGAELLRRVAAADGLDEDLALEAERALEQVAAQGEYAWSPEQREDLDAVVRNLGRTLRRAGRPVSSEATRLRRFEGRSPRFAEMDGDEFVACLARDDSVVGRRLVAPHPGAQLPEKDLAGAQVLDCAFVGWSFDGVDLSGSRIAHSVFQGCSFDRADLTAAIATTCRFDGATDSGAGSFRVTAPRANFAGSYLGSCDVREAEFSEAAFSYAYLWSLQADETTVLERATLDMATLDHVKAAGARFASAVFAGATLANVDLRYADLQNAVFSSAKVAGARFESATLDGAAFRTAYFVALAHFDDTALGADFTDEDRAILQQRLGPDDDSAQVDLRADDSPQ